MTDLLAEHPVAGLIVGCEIGLWVLLGLGLALRYLARLRLLSTLVLAAIPLLDVVLVVATALDLHRGAPAGLSHGLAAVYLGFSVAFGPALVRWADARFAHRFAGGPAPVRPPRRGPGRQKHLWREWYRVVVAAAITSAVLGGLVLLVASPEQDGPLAGWIGRVWAVVGLWLLLGPVWEEGRNRGREPDGVADPADVAGGRRSGSVSRGR
ncbi:hypothetical protein GC722_08300 [Auraticoccus sp. F435]|uniref:Uncharacterized protein n=1 Tax=Auraticoccus cholistanensis TaxID=2656650 RepID=A0A6A9UWK9_9ACTN|nr:hypothetical protein [Auraticoccus cholistanensis]MVA76022.1 hypothetical protein [Auraticoccus cholistanensis]